MADFPLWKGGNQFEAGDRDFVNSRGVLGTVGGTNTKGAWLELIAATSFDYGGFWLSMWGFYNELMLADVAIGAAASEVIVVENLMLGNKNSPRSQIDDYLPIQIPKGSRIAVRTQSSAASGNYLAGVFGFAPSPAMPVGYGRATNFGANTANSSGVVINAGSADAKGAWSEIVASTTHQIKLLYLNFVTNRQGNLYSNDYFVDIAIGASGNEEVLVSDFIVQGDSACDAPIRGLYGPFPVDIPAGSRLAVRMQTGSISIQQAATLLGIG